MLSKSFNCVRQPNIFPNYWVIGAFFYKINAVQFIQCFGWKASFGRQIIIFLRVTSVNVPLLCECGRSGPQSVARVLQCLPALKDVFRVDTYGALAQVACVGQLTRACLVTHHDGTSYALFSGIRCGARLLMADEPSPA